MTENTENIEEPLFKEKLRNRGWTLNMVKNDTTMMTTSLYDDGGKFIETMAYNLKLENDLKIFRLYVSYFKEHPKNNLKKMLKLKVRI